MAILKTFWNFVDCAKNTNLRMFAKPTAIVNQKAVADGCRGVYFRSVLSEELDASNLINELKFEDIRRARSEPDQSLLFNSKCKNEKSIGVLRIIKPRRFVGVSGINTDLTNVNIERVSREFDVLLETTEFILEDAQEQMQERFQLQETFGDFNVYFFGKRAEIFSYSGSLLNASGNLQWRNQFLYNYENFLRGTKCAELKARAYLLYDDVIREGFIISAGTNQNSITEGVVKFNFTLLVTSKRTMGFVPVSRSGTLTLDQAGTMKSGVTDFKFIRATDPDLPSVLSRVEADQITEAGSIVSGAVPDNVAFIENTSLPGDEPPDDLKQQMITRGLAAIQQVTANQDIQVSDDSVDHDVLLDFISASKLGSTTKLIISGAKSLDVDNFDGDQLVALLMDNKITVDDLKFKQAVAVADSLSRTNQDFVSNETSSTLASLAKFFAANANQRVSVPVTDLSSRIIAAPKEYVLQASLDNATLPAVITSTEPFRSFDQAGVSYGIVSKMSFGLVKEITASGPDAQIMKVIQLYLATFLTVKDPVTGNLFSEVTSVLHANPAGQSDLFAYIDTLPIVDIASFINAIAATSSATMSAAIADISGCGFFGLVGTQLSIAGGSVPLTDGVLNSIMNGVPVGSFNNARFLYAISIYFGGLMAEIFDGVRPLSCDAVGGTTKAIGSNSAVSYFDASADSDLTQGANPDMAALLSIGPVTPFPNYLASSGGGGYLKIPFAYDVLGSVFAVTPGAVFGENTMEITPDLVNPSLYNAGFIKLTSQQYSALSSAKKATFFFRGTKRKTPNLIAGSTSMQTPSSIVIFEDNIPFPSNQKSSFFNISKLPIDQNHYGAKPIQAIPANCDTLRNIFTTISNRVVEKIKDITHETTDFLVDVLKTSSPGLGSGFEKQLSVDRYTSIAAVAALNTALNTVGVTPPSIGELVLYSKAESDMAKKMTALKNGIVSGISESGNDPENRAAAVAKSNQSLMGSVCS